MLNYIELDQIKQLKESYRDAFMKASPFRHIVFDGLTTADSLNRLDMSFPSIDWDGWNNVSHEHQFLKKSCDKIESIPEPLRTLIFELNSAPFLDWLSYVTGIPQLLPDPHLIGGGLHLSGSGGTLTPHTDFHVVKGISLYRRLNLLFYMNRDWQPENGGMLELWDKKKDIVERSILPSLGTCVLFQTDNDSMHGFMNPVTQRDRRSVAIYYYTAEDAERFSGDSGTHWRYESLAGHENSLVRLKISSSLMFFSRAFSGLSWLCNRAATRLERKK